MLWTELVPELTGRIFAVSKPIEQVFRRHFGHGARSTVTARLWETLSPEVGMAGFIAVGRTPVHFGAL